MLCGRLLTDNRVPKTEKALLAGAIIYALVPLDIIPDFIPFIGQVDDIYLVAITLMRLLDHTDEAILREHWRGGGDVVQLVRSAADLAPRLLPKRVTAILQARLKLQPRGTAETLLAVANSQPILLEIGDE
jgi:uncharacterized membrane protein YkvA (DUF1232 family)